MEANLMPGRRDFLGISSRTALAVALIGGMSGCSAAVASATTDATTAGTPDATLQAADTLFRAGHFAQADALYEQVLDSDPGNPHALAQHGYVAMLDNRLHWARALLQQASAQPGNQPAAQNLAATLYRLNDFPAAAAAYRRLGSPSAPMAQMLASFGNTVPYQLAGPDATRLPFLRTSPLPMVSISVNGSAPVPVHLDTGASTLGLIPSYAASAGVTQVAPGWGRAERVRLGDIEVRNVPVMVGQGQGSNLRAPDGTPDHGIIGTSLLSQFLFTMDYAGAALELRRPGPARLSQAAALPAGAASVPFWAASVPFWMAGDHFMLTWASFNQRAPQLLIIDTGGANTGLAITAAEATAAGVKLDKSKEQSAPGGIVNGKTVTTTFIPFTVASLALGGAVNCGFPGTASITQGPAVNLGFTTGGRVSHSFFLPFAATFDFTRMRLSLQGNASSCHPHP